MSRAESRLRVLTVPEWHPWPEKPAQGSWVREQVRAISSVADVAILATRPSLEGLRPRYEMTDEVEGGLRTVRVRYTRGRISAMARGLRHLEASGFVPDVIHAHVFSAGFPSLFLARRLRVPLIVSEHSTAFPRGILSKWDRFTARLAFHRADLVCPASTDLGRYVKAVAPRARMQPMPNVVDTTTFAPRNGAARNGGPVRLINVASLHEKKGHEFLLEAVASLAGQGTDVVLTIVGDGPRRGELEALAGELDLLDRVRFVGLQDKQEVARLLGEADLFVLSSRWENAPHAVIEALASGLPVVATDVGGVSELVEGTPSVLVRSADADALADAIAAGIRQRHAVDPQELAAHAHRSFGHEHVARRWLDLYESVACARSSSRNTGHRRS